MGELADDACECMLLYRGIYKWRIVIKRKMYRIIRDIFVNEMDVGLKTTAAARTGDQFRKDVTRATIKKQLRPTKRIRKTSSLSGRSPEAERRPRGGDVNVEPDNLGSGDASGVVVRRRVQTRMRRSQSMRTQTSSHNLLSSSPTPSTPPSPMVGRNDNAVVWDDLI